MSAGGTRRRGLFITGTDTNVGKTVVSSLLVSALRQRGFSSGYFKPVQTGTDSDSESVHALSGLSREWVATPVYSFPEPISPHRAASLHGEDISIQAIRGKWNQLPERAWVVEGAGGLLVPLNRGERIRDLVMALSIPLVVVASTRLGTINHTLLTLESAARAGIRVLGIVLVGDGDRGLEKVLGELTSVPVLTRVPWLSEVNRSSVEKLAVEVFSATDLQTWFGE